ncbi:MAG TPA: GNAT family N-acetyltransferase [Candidatus Limnocylindrales bacterium]
MPITIRPVTADELLPWLQQLSSTFFIWGLDPEASMKMPWITQDLDRRIGAFDGDRMVGTYRTFGTELTLPGGRQVQASAVSAVTTRPTHRRRGVLTQFMDDDIARCVDRGDVASVLYAAEWPIYGRYGYGMATSQARWTLRTRAATFLRPATGTMEIVTGPEARPIVPEIHRLFALRQAGAIQRPEHNWDQDLGLMDIPGRPRWKGYIAIHRDDDGTPDGYLRYTGEERWEDGIPDNIVKAEELVGLTPAVEVELWRFLASLDLVSEARIGGHRPDEGLPWHLADGRALQLLRMSDGLWLRPYDVARLLGERAYEREATLVIEVEDRLGDRSGPAAGRFRLETAPDGATCRPTTDAPDLTVSVQALGAASLGGTRLAAAVNSWPATEHRPGALAALDGLLKTAAEPWCSTFF